MLAIDHYRRGDWAGLKAYLSSLAPDAAYQQIIDLGFEIPVKASLASLIDGPRDVAGLTIAGGLSRYRAWRLRGGLVAEMTSDESFARYFDELERTFKYLRSALAIDATHGLAAALLASACLDAEAQDKEEAEALMAAATGVPVIGHLELMTAWTAKWGGSQETMWAYLDRNARRSVPGTLALIPRAHWEQKNCFDLASQGKKARGYYKRPAVRAALSAASDESLSAPADTDPYLLRVADAWFALTLVGAGEAARARRHLQRLGRYIDPTIWHYGLVFITPRMRFAFTRWRAGLL
jgi:hypothetical protein